MDVLRRTAAAVHTAGQQGTAAGLVVCTGIPRRCRMGREYAV